MEQFMTTNSATVLQAWWVGAPSCWKVKKLPDKNEWLSLLSDFLTFQQRHRTLSSSHCRGHRTAWISIQWTTRFGNLQGTSLPLSYPCRWPTERLVDGWCYFDQIKDSLTRQSTSGISIDCVDVSMQMWDICKSLDCSGWPSPHHRCY